MRDLAFYAFDLLVDQGEDITGCPISSARSGSRRCSRRVPPPILYGDHVIGKGEALFDAICTEGGEGIIAKKANAPYRGARAKNWLKVKCIQRQEFVIVGWQASDKRRGFRSLHLAVRDGKQADLCRQGRHRLRHRDDREPERDDATAGSRHSRRSTCRAPRCAGRTG